MLTGLELSLVSVPVSISESEFVSVFCVASENPKLSSF